MDLNVFLSSQAILLKKEEMGSVIGPDVHVFSTLIKHAFNRKMPECWRAAWLMDYLAEIHPWLAEKHINSIWKKISKNHPDGVNRSVLRMLTRYNIPEPFQGVATDLCLNWITQESVPVAIKVHSMGILLKIAKTYPELSNEFIVVIEEHIPNNSIAFKARARHIIAHLKKLKPIDD